jgi:hypothetical protein
MKATTPVAWSHVNDSERDRTPITPQQKSAIIDKIINAGSAAGLSQHETAHVLALVNFESGFNPNAANPASSASGLGQFNDSTGAKYSLVGEDIWNVDLQVTAVVKHFQQNKAIAENNNLGEEGIYGAHHDGAAGVLKANAPGLDLARERVLPKIPEFEALIDKKVASGEVDFSGSVSSSSPGTSNTSSPSPTTSGSHSPTGRWDDTTQYDAMGNVSVSGERVWVSDAPTTASTSPASSSASTSPTSATTPSAAHPVPTHPNTTQISPDGTSASLPNGQVIHAGTGASLYIDREGNLVADRPAAGWTNADGSDSDIRQITTYDTKGAQIGTVIAQSLPGQSALIENGEERSFTTTQGDGKFGHTHRYCVVNTKGPANNSSWRFAA